MGGQVSSVRWALGSGGLRWAAARWALGWRVRRFIHQRADGGEQRAAGRRRPAARYNVAPRIILTLGSARLGRSRRRPRPAAGRVTRPIPSTTFSPVAAAPGIGERRCDADWSAGGGGGGGGAGGGGRGAGGEEDQSAVYITC